MEENSVLCGELRAPRCPGFYRLVLRALLHLRLLHRYRKTTKIYSVSSNNTKWEYGCTSTKRPVTYPVTRRRTSTERPVIAWISMKKGKTRKFTLTSWKTKIAKCRRTRTTWTLCKRRTGEAIPRAAKFGRIDNNNAHSLNWDMWIGKQSPIRHRGATFGSMKIHDETKNSRATWNHFMDFGKKMWSEPWNYYRISSTPHRSKRFGLAEKRCAEWKKEPFRNCCNWPLDGGWIPWWIATICEKKT